MIRQAIATAVLGGAVLVGAPLAPGLSGEALERVTPEMAAAAVEGAPAAPCPVAPASIVALYVIESGGATFGGAEVDELGNVRPVIRGVPLDGTGGHAYVPDSDGGALDGDAVYDRAVGPGQFIPTTWAQVGTDGNGDGVADPDNLSDAAASTAVLLCEYGYDVLDENARRRAFGRYHGSGEHGAYAAEAIELEQRYTGDLGPQGEPAPPSGPQGEPSADGRPTLGAVADELWWRALGVWETLGGLVDGEDTPTLAAGWAAVNAPLAAVIDEAAPPSSAAADGWVLQAPGNGTARVKVDGDRRLASVDRWWDGCTPGTWPGPLTTEQIGEAADELNRAFGTYNVGQHRAWADRYGPGRDPCSDHLQGAGTDHGGYEAPDGRLVLPREAMAELAAWSATRVGSGPEHPFRLVQYWNGAHYGHHVHISWNPNWDPVRYPLRLTLSSSSPTDAYALAS